MPANKRKAVAPPVNPADSWAARVEEWADDRDILSGSVPLMQFGKLLEEVNELYDSLMHDDYEAAQDAIGDCCVVLRIIAAQLNLPWDSCLEQAWDSIKHRKGKLVNGVFVKDA